jgi:hypothetical protein
VSTYPTLSGAPGQLPRPRKNPSQTPPQSTTTTTTARTPSNKPHQNQAAPKQKHHHHHFFTTTTVLTTHPFYTQHTNTKATNPSRIAAPKQQNQD